MKIIITETKLRNIVRTELQNYLLQEGFLDNVQQKIGSAVSSAKQKLISVAPKGVKSFFDVATEYNKVKTILDKLQIKSVSLYKVYSLLFKKDDQIQRDMIRHGAKPIQEFEKTINDLLQIVKDSFKDAKPTINAPMEERKKRGPRNKIITQRSQPVQQQQPAQQAAPAARQVQFPQRQQAKQTQLQKLYVIFDQQKTKYNTYVASSEPFGALVCAVGVYACQVVNLALNTSNVTKEQTQLLQDFLNQLKQQISSFRRITTQNPTQTQTP